MIQVTAPFFERKNIDAPRLTAEILLAHVLDCARIDLYTRFETPLPSDKVDAYRDLVRRRAAHEPIQHLTGRTEFWSQEIKCDRRAMIPRPETELIVEATVNLLHGESAPAIAEIGTGTGCIAVALGLQLPEASVVASDISADALALASENLAAHGLADRVLLLEGDLAAPFLKRGRAVPFNALVSNPPYVTDAEMSDLMPEVRCHDPETALRAGPDGLDLIRRLVADAPALLKSGGFLIMEIGHDQADAVRGLLVATGRWELQTILRDGAGIERTVVARRAEQP